ncbi:Superoxide dismutase [Cu-Zn] precursor [Kingella potus]|uniref:Superoxide dismutase [Cu-Zn] n=1 Tax=Kingella potus TaxID=265175 RepID=A0A377R139_9NEIS|nr:superoxide dismutase family protein [Kingella potus]UOP00322.1 superoxide dismutase family protein [Kingella potus]STR02618.1 Superoxide dismutase [Cu-Zn] precursor [Kingella potus]
MQKTLAALLCAVSLGAYAQSEITVPVALLNANGDTPVGEIRISQNKYGAIFTPHLKNIPAGVYGFHVHEHPSCAPAEKDGKPVLGLSAGGHWDPHQANAHKGPWDDSGRLGDLPALAIDARGHGQPVLAPRIKDISQLHGHSLVIHVGGDNYSDHPAPLGGGGARMACGVIR